MDQLYNFRLKHQLLPAEERYKHYSKVYSRKGWSMRRMTLEELDKIPAMDGKVKDDMETAARWRELAGGYWLLHREYFGSEGTSRGPELHQQIYDLLYEKLGPWSSCTKYALGDYCRWDISSSERTKIVGRVLTHMGQRKGYDGVDEHLIYAVVMSCLRNDDYSDNVKELAVLCLHIGQPYSYWKTWAKILFSIHIGRQEWAQAEDLGTKYLESMTRVDREVTVYADLGEVQIRRGKLVDGEATLRKGTERSGPSEDWIDHLSCHERLVDLYMQQERWDDAEETGWYLIRSREDEIYRGDSLRWDREARRAARIIKICRWRVEGMARYPMFNFTERPDKKLYYIHALYNDKHKLAKVFTQLKKYDEAQRLLEELMEDKMHMENPILVASKELLITVYFELGEWEKGEKMQEKIVEEMTGRLGYDSEELIPALEKLADIYQKSDHLGKRHHIKLRLLRYR